MQQVNHNFIFFIHSTSHLSIAIHYVSHIISILIFIWNSCFLYHNYQSILLYILYYFKIVQWSNLFRHNRNMIFGFLMLRGSHLNIFTGNGVSKASECCMYIIIIIDIIVIIELQIKCQQTESVKFCSSFFYEFILISYAYLYA